MMPVLLMAEPAQAHSTDQAFVLLLPTGVYTAAGTAAVALTLLVMALLPAGRPSRPASGSRPPALPAQTPVPARDITLSLLTLAFLALLVWLGLTGARGPLSNPLPLFIWSIWWICLPPVQALLGDIWRHANPWIGLHALLAGEARLIALPAWLGAWPAIATFLAFALFQLADLAPDDPARLARAVAGYWLATFLLMLVFGRDWLQCGECFSVLGTALARLAPVWVRPAGRPTGDGAALGVFLLVVLGAGSFDGLNESFWWLGLIGINPLEFPGRSAVFWPTTLGLLAACAVLVGIFAATLWVGLALVGRSRLFGRAFPPVALSVLPIALGYHLAHYLVAFLVGAQYALAAASDPFATGADYLGLGQFYVTTGFLNARDTVEAIWLTQAAAVVVGHVWAVVLADRAIRRICPTRRAALIAQLPVSAFMLAYTVFGLWLLATPRGG